MFVKSACFFEFRTHKRTYVSYVEEKYLTGTVLYGHFCRVTQREVTKGSFHFYFCVYFYVVWLDVSTSREKHTRGADTQIDRAQSMVCCFLFTVVITVHIQQNMSRVLETMYIFLIINVSISIKTK
jgi:hypothetical protein